MAITVESPKLIKAIYTFNQEFDNGNSGASPTINWNTAQKQRITLDNNATFAFTAPASGVGNFVLKIIQDATGSRTVSLPATARASDGTLSFSTTANAVDILFIYFDGTNYHCALLNNSSVITP